MKEMKIVVPEGYEIDKENSTFECIKFKSKMMNYKDVAEALFGNQDCVYFINSAGDIDSIDIKACGRFAGDPNNAPTKRQLEKVLAYNKLLNVAYYFNSKHAPSDSVLYFITLDNLTDELLVAGHAATFLGCEVFFNVKDDAKNAIEILGEDVVKTALGVL